MTSKADFAASALISYDEGVTNLAAIAARVKRAGFRVPVEERDLLPAEADAAKTAAAADALRAVVGVKEAAVQAALSRSASCAAATRIRSSKSAWACSKRS